VLLAGELGVVVAAAPRVGERLVRARDRGEDVVRVLLEILEAEPRERVGVEALRGLEVRLLELARRRVLRDAEKLVVRELREPLALFDDLGAQLRSARVLDGLGLRGARFARRRTALVAAADDLDLDLGAVRGGGRRGLRRGAAGGLGRRAGRPPG
jgi:hypothetical protein